MRTAFIGSTRRGYLTLEALVRSGAEIVGVISLEQHAHETDRCEGEFRAFCELSKIPLLEARTLSRPEHAAWIRQNLDAELAYVVGCRVLLPKQVFQAFPKGCLAVHDSLLPRYRGFAPLNWALINGESRTGVTLFHISEGMDEGDIVGQIAIEVSPSSTAPELFEEVCKRTIELVTGAHPKLVNGTAKRTPQDESKATYTCSRTPADGWLRWELSTSSLYNLVRGLAYPYPGAYTWYESSSLRVWSAEIVSSPREYSGRVPGRVVAVNSNEGSVDVLTGDGVLRLHDVQPEGKDRCKAASVIKSVRASLGASPADLLQMVRAISAPGRPG